MVVAAVSAGLLAIVALGVAREYRWRTVRSRSLEEARFALAVAPREFDASTFERFRLVYEQRSDADILVVHDGEVFASAANLGVDDLIPLETLREDPTLTTWTVNGRETLVAAARGPDSAEYYMFFRLDQLRDSLDDLSSAMVVSWCGMVVFAAIVGRAIAKRTLRPVADAAGVAQAITNGNLDARLGTDGNDEFGDLARSFNHMADAVRTSIGELEAAAERERRFTADVAHELRTPLTGLWASASLIAERIDEVPPSMRRPVQLLTTDVERFRSLVLELLELALLDSSTDDPVVEDLELDRAVEAVLVGMPSDRRAAVEVDLDGQLRILADSRRFRRILGNLIDNAIVHGGGRVWITASASDREVVVAIIDDGDGIPPEEVDRVFERFHKSERSQARGGSGLGLAIARQNARSLDGEVDVATEVGGGTRFTVRFPRPPRAAFVRLAQSSDSSAGETLQALQSRTGDHGGASTIRRDACAELVDGDFTARRAKRANGGTDTDRQ